MQSRGPPKRASGSWLTVNRREERAEGLGLIRGVGEELDPLSHLERSEAVRATKPLVGITEELAGIRDGKLGLL